MRTSSDFAFTLGMTFQTADVDVGDRRIRGVVTLHCLAAFVFNLGILAFTINGARRSGLTQHDDISLADRKGCLGAGVGTWLVDVR